MFLLCETKLTNKTNEKKWNKEKKKGFKSPQVPSQLENFSLFKPQTNTLSIYYWIKVFWLGGHLLEGRV